MYKIDASQCTGCGACVSGCYTNAIVEANGKYTITDDCVDCGVCQDSCPVDAIKA
ncbi:4Fe-4S dicluster domain-containing protein [Heliobacillus mobilis]|uniref:4Fe-4S dicluster domain-containing protein n=1 Tax=Heliobacterium mobile TaxID=28064 RepID=Q6L9F5_HELMO|nr:4Fe-4S binding protein [Heliobacterium mobile]MTV48818.1 4Fe-4S dicluster domain-containing protein [Heliobacterium mobile]BAD22819.1 ferredoxin2 [Heliobacterium mobile]